MLSFTSTALLLTSTLVGSALAAPAAPSDIVGDLRDAPTAVDRVALLPNDSQFVFNFFDPALKATTGAGGKVITANAGNFPAVVGNGAAMAIGILEPCGLNTPHTHPRATEIQFNVNGTTIRTGMITENNARFVMTDLSPGGMTIFPQGSVHFQMNEGCTPALFVSGFNSEDPGALQIAQRFTGLPPDIVGATLGDIGVEEVYGVDAMIPDSVALGTDACLKRCGITRKTQPTTQRQPRVSGNAFPSGVSASAWPQASKYY
ncbi:RmlC-like cupin domain-containing protein [Mycena filopes]|nr:RmlC-like cupin domain-containing protein [Mycena filopes]